VNKSIKKDKLQEIISELPPAVINKIETEILLHNEKEDIVFWSDTPFTDVDCMTAYYFETPTHVYRFLYPGFGENDPVIIDSMPVTAIRDFVRNSSRFKDFINS
jgi:hypothetical protein